MKPPALLSLLTTVLLSTNLLSSRVALAVESGDWYQRRGSWAETMVATRERLVASDRADAAASDQMDGEDRNAMVSRETRPDRAGQMATVLRRLWQDFAETDWFLQDQPNRVVADEVDPQRDLGWYFEPSREPSGEQAMIRRVLSEIEADVSGLRQRLEQLTAADTGVEDPAWLQLYSEACQVRRGERLASLSRQASRIVFTKHYTLGGSHYAYTEGQSDAQHERHFYPGAALCLLQWDGSQFVEQTLLDDPDGVIRDPDVSYDGQRVLFAWKKSDRDDDYHLYEMDLDSRQTRQLTFGLGVADYEGAYLPDGEIIFNSTRCVQIVDCWWTEVSNLYRCDPDGRFLRRLAFDQVHDNFPTVTPDGRILYTRWEYNDRGQIYPQPLLQMNPDGTNQSEFYGGNSWFPTTILHARAIPGTTKVLAIATGHHSRQTGKLIEIDPSQGRQENEGVQLVAPVRRTPRVRVDAYGQEGQLFQYPYPLSEHEYLVTYHPVGWAWEEGAMGPRFGIYYFTREGRRELLAADRQYPCNQPIPVRPRADGHQRPSQVDYRQSTAACYIQDVHAGPAVAGVARGAIKRLRVVGLEFRAAGVGANENGGPGGGALISTPIAVGNGAWDPKVILGDATVHEDGSVYFRLPARTPVYFQLLDEQGQMVQTMRSWTTLQPGETASCVGCHEHKNSVPLAAIAASQALRAGAQELQEFYGPPRGFSFTREIQPILDRHCVECHGGENPTPPDLSGRAVVDTQAKRAWSRAYLQLTHARPDDESGKTGWRGDPDRPLVNWISAQSVPTLLPPYTTGSGQSELMRLLRQDHEQVVLSQEELDKLSAWIDLSVPFCGDYLEAHAWDDTELAKYRHFLEKRRRLAAAEQAGIADWLQHSSKAAQ